MHIYQKYRNKRVKELYLQKMLIYKKLKWKMKNDSIFKIRN